MTPTYLSELMRMTDICVIDCATNVSSAHRHHGLVHGGNNGFTPGDTFNTLRPRQNDRHFADDIFKCLFALENVWIWIKISLNSVPKGRIKNIPALVQTMASHREGDQPLSEPLMVSLMIDICVTRLQLVFLRLQLMSPNTGHWAANMWFKLIYLSIRYDKIFCLLTPAMRSYSRPYDAKVINAHVQIF